MLDLHNPCKPSKLHHKKMYQQGDKEEGNGKNNKEGFSSIGK